MKLSIPNDTSILADSAVAQARRVATALSGNWTTEPALDATDACLVTLIVEAKMLRMHIRGVRAEARRVARAAA